MGLAQNAQPKLSSNNRTYLNAWNFYFYLLPCFSTKLAKKFWQLSLMQAVLFSQGNREDPLLSHPMTYFFHLFKLLGLDPFVNPFRFPC